MVTSRLSRSRERPAALSRQHSNDSNEAERRQSNPSKEFETEGMGLNEIANAIRLLDEYAQSPLDLGRRIHALPVEILLMISSHLSDKDLWALTKVSPLINEVLTSYDFMHFRELQCFCLKKSFMEIELGVGVYVHSKGREVTFKSEFDLISKQAFVDYEIDTSVLGLPFKYWLPLPLSKRHWKLVRLEAIGSLRELACAANLKNMSSVNVIYHFMNDIIFASSQQAENCINYDLQSSLTHVSTKVVESYFNLFHLLLCLANEDEGITCTANATVNSFLQGQTSKSSCPNLGHLLVAALVSDAGITEQLRIAVIKEAILRNVVWMLDPTGANMPELAYQEPSAISEYRLRRSFQASKNSYRQLMFLNLFCGAARGEGVPLNDLCGPLFEAHGAPPKGTAERLASEVRQIKDIDSFPPFFTAMGVKKKNEPSKENFTAFLKRMVKESMQKGYSCMPMTQGEALALRKKREPGVEVAKGVVRGRATQKIEAASFFPSGGSRK